MKLHMSKTKLKILLSFLILAPIPFSCEDKNECFDLYVEPYYDIQDIAFIEVDAYSYTKGGILNINTQSQDYNNMVYDGGSLALYFMAPDTSLSYHSQYIIKPKFSFVQEAYACNSLRPGYKGTQELVDKIYLSSNYDFDETHPAHSDLSDIVDIFAYASGGTNSWMSLRAYNELSPHEAPKRFYLLIKRNPSPDAPRTQQFVLRYYMMSNPGEAVESYVVETPLLHVE